MIHSWTHIDLCCAHCVKKWPKCWETGPGPDLGSRIKSNLKNGLYKNKKQKKKTMYLDHCDQSYFDL